MTISTLSGIGGLQQPQSVSNASSQLQAAISNILGGQTDSTSVSEASQLQAQTSGLKQVLLNLSQGSSLTAVASSGINDIEGALIQLQVLAQQASTPALSQIDQQALNDQFGKALGTIDSIASGTTFDGKSLLNGSLSGKGALSLNALLGTKSGSDNTLSIGNLNSSGLLANVGDLSTPANAQQALGVINNAISQVATTGAAVDAFQQTLNYAAANIDSAGANIEASKASLSESDLASASTQAAQGQFQLNASVALAAQGNINPALLQLVS